MFNKLFLSTICIFIFNCSLAQKDKTISVGHVDSIQSKILNQKREILVHVPSGASASDSFPVLFVFDGDALFIKTVGILSHLSSDYGNHKCPPMIVVGIRHINRMKDLYPVLNDKNPFENDKFADFLEKELIPYIDSNYPSKPFRVLAGHSIGGLRVANTAVYHSKSFQAYIALDPSLGHDMNKWSYRTDSLLKKVNYSNQFMFVAMAQTMPVLTDTSIIYQDSSGDARHMRAIMRYCYGYEKYKIQGIDFNWKYYSDETHSGVTFLGLYDGLVSVFSWYEFKESKQLFDSSLSIEQAKQLLKEHYVKMSQKLGYPCFPSEQYLNFIVDNFWGKQMIEKATAFAELNCHLYPDSESAINYLGYLRIEQNKLTEALFLFESNVKLHPESSNAWDSYGECLLLLGKKQEAILAYEKAIELNPKNNNSINMLKKIKSND